MISNKISITTIFGHKHFKHKFNHTINNKTQTVFEVDFRLFMNPYRESMLKLNFEENSNCDQKCYY